MTNGTKAIAFGAGAAFALLAGGTAPARAQELSFTVAPYVWIAGLRSTTTLNGHTVNNVQSFGDLVKSSETLFGFTGFGEVRYGSWSFFLDGVYTRVTDDATLRNTIPLSVKIATSYLDFGIAYRFDLFGAAQGGGWAMSLEPYVAGRYSSMNVSIRGQNAGVIDVSRNIGGVDPLFGARLLLEHNDGWRFRVAGDIGGFGAHSRITWTVSALVGYRFETFGVWQTLWVGYKALGSDLENRRGPVQIKMNQVMHGPMIGSSFRF